MSTINSFIDSTLTDMSSKKSTAGAVIKRDASGTPVKKGGTAQLAKIIQAMPHEHAANRIATAYVKLSNDRTAAKRAKSAVQANPEQLISFLQLLMNQICWNARRLMAAQIRTDAEDQANGVDFSQDIAAAVGVEGVSTDRIAEIVADDHFVLQNLQTWLASKMSYLDDIEPLFLYADRQPVVTEAGDTEWVLVAHADTFEQALALMDGVTDALREDEAKQTGSEAINIDFTMTAETAPVPVPRSPSHHAVGQTYRPQPPLGASNKDRGPVGLWARIKHALTAPMPA